MTNQQDKKNTASLALVSLLLFANCQQWTLPIGAAVWQLNGIPPRQDAKIVADDIPLLNSVLMYFNQGTSRGFVVIWDTMPFNVQSDSKWYDVSKARHPQIAFTEALVDFNRRNVTSVPAPLLKVGVPLIYRPKAEMNAIFEHGWWNDFYDRFPSTGGKVHFTLPGYSADHNTALVYVEVSRGGLNGEGSLILMTKNAGVWTVIKKLGGWVS